MEEDSLLNVLIPIPNEVLKSHDIKVETKDHLKKLNLSLVTYILNVQRNVLPNELKSYEVEDVYFSILQKNNRLFLKKYCRQI